MDFSELKTFSKIELNAIVNQLVQNIIDLIRQFFYIVLNLKINDFLKYVKETHASPNYEIQILDVYLNFHN